MKRFLLPLVFALIQGNSFATHQDIRFVSDPSLSPDGNIVVFSYENDLWRLSINDSVAYRLTAMDGKESLPRFSPNGEWIAFTASQNGRENVYIVPAAGGEVKQLTYHQASDHVDSWSWDSQWIYFSSDRYNLYSSYRVSVFGGTPQRLFDHFFNNPHHLVEHPLTNEFYFTDSWESFMFPQRKRYKGEHSPQILSYCKKTDKLTKHTDYMGKNMWPTIDSKGTLFFVSDEFNDEYNLYSLKGGQKERLTSFDQSIKRPQVSANGKRLVFVKDYQLWLYDVDGVESYPLKFSLFQNSTLGYSQKFNVENNISVFDVSPDGEKIAFVSRGELFVSDLKGMFIKNLPTNTAERMGEVIWLSDSQNLLFSQTANGYTNWFSISANGLEKEKQITFDSKSNRQLSVNSKHTKGVYLSGRDEVKLIDLKTLKTSTITKAELWGFGSSTPRFSPDDRYIAYTTYSNFESDIMVFDLETKLTYNITNTGVSEINPYWSADGKYIYFTSDRFTPSYPKGIKNSTIYRIPLHRFIENLKGKEFDNLFVKSEKDTVPIVTLDMQDLIDRWEPIRVPGGEQYLPYLVNSKTETLMLFASTHDKGELALWQMESKPFEKPTFSRLSNFELRNEFQVSENSKGLFVLANGNIYRYDKKKKSLEAIEISHSFSRTLSDEFCQMFYETWATLDENFYDENFHGINWEEKRDYYAGFLVDIRHRDNLRELLNDMLGELNASHMGFRSKGDEEKSFYNTYTASLGVAFYNENPYRIERILRNSNLDLTNPILKAGDIITAVNGDAVSPLVNREFYFSLPIRLNEFSLTIKREGVEIKVNVPTHTAEEISDLLYDEWITRTKEYVNKKSNGQAAYVHMKDMSTKSYEQFVIDMTTHANNADALVFDLRYNRGGNVHDDVLSFLSQKPYLNWKYREGMLSPQPNFAPSAKPMILVMNEHSLSDAEMTAAGFRELGLGKLLGTETYRWIIFTSGKSLVDGSFVRI
ncbi:MAG: S41 family peptidase, partial [Bacteroidales bacterium]|nr:S41 family peptidase [Bacteroidales bacterium]